MCLEAARSDSPPTKLLVGAIEENGLDDRAAVALRSAVQWVQRQVLDQVGSGDVS